MPPRPLPPQHCSRSCSRDTDVYFVYGANNYNSACVVNGSVPDFEDPNLAIGKYDARTGMVTHFACDRDHGGEVASGPDTGPATDAHCCAAFWATPLPNGDVVINDGCDNTLRIVYANGTMAILAGRRGVAGFAGDGGPFRDALFDGVGYAAATPDGTTLYVIDGDNARIRALDLVAGTINTVVGNGGVYDAAVLQRAPDTPPTELGIGSVTLGGAASSFLTTVRGFTACRWWLAPRLVYFVASFVANLLLRPTCPCLHFPSSLRRTTTATCCLTWAARCTGL